MSKGWFAIPGVQRGSRTLEEQMLGLAPAIAEVKGKRVLDLGCAEALIALEFARAGAQVVGIECNVPVVKEARRQCADACRILLAKVGDEPLPPGPWHIVLALALLHKLADPAGVIKEIAAFEPELVVVRLPAGSAGHVVTKRHCTPCDIPAEFRRCGYRLDQEYDGPFGERVHYWRPC